MQEPDGSMTMLAEEEITPGTEMSPKVIRVGQCFKVKHCYFRITNITPQGIEAKGISRREYFDSR